MAIPILLTNTEAQKARYIPPLCDFKNAKLCAFALTEAEAGSDVTALRTTAKRAGDSYLLNGQKCYITFGGLADLYLVFAKVESAGIAAFLVEGQLSAGAAILILNAPTGHLWLGHEAETACLCGCPCAPNDC